MSRILHIDMDAFFAAVEVVRDPSLAGKPLIVGGDKYAKRGVVSTASYEARKFGVHSAMPIAQARRLCPHGIYLRGDHAQYREVSKRIRAILESVSPLVQMASIDEAYVDITGSIGVFGSEDAIGRYLRDTIRAETGLPCTIAIASNKLVAKVASDAAKPDGFRRIPAGNERAFLAPMPVRKLPGVGPRMNETLERMGIRQVADLAERPLVDLERRFGEQMALHLLRTARGESNSKVVVNGMAKSISRETTFEDDVADWDELERVLVALAEHCARSLRKAGMEARRVTLKVRYRGFDTKTFALTVASPVRLDTAIMDAVRRLIPKARKRKDPVRLIGVGLSQMSVGHQLEFFQSDSGDRWNSAFESVDRLRDRHGAGILHLGTSTAHAGRASDRGMSWTVRPD